MLARLRTVSRLVAGVGCAVQSACLHVQSGAQSKAVSERDKSSEAWKSLLAQGHNVNPCQSEHHPAVKAGFVQAQGPAKALQEAYTPDSTCPGCGSLLKHISILHVLHIVVVPRPECLVLRRPGMWGSRLAPALVPRSPRLGS